MIRFVDLSDAYWTDPVGSGRPICAFLSTGTNKFILSVDGQHTFSSEDEIRECDQGERMWGLTPKGFFEGNTCVKETQDDLALWIEVLLLTNILREHWYQAPSPKSAKVQAMIDKLVIWYDYIPERAFEGHNGLGFKMHLRQQILKTNPNRRFN